MAEHKIETRKMNFYVENDEMGSIILEGTYANCRQFYTELTAPETLELILALMVEAGINTTDIQHQMAAKYGD